MATKKIENIDWDALGKNLTISSDDFEKFRDEMMTYSYKKASTFTTTASTSTTPATMKSIITPTPWDGAPVSSATSKKLAAGLSAFLKSGAKSTDDWGDPISFSLPAAGVEQERAGDAPESSKDPLWGTW
ncbi:hypothetical protein [Castellaniella sp.]|uniref:hypothetical protein n=1 Tax=Castellaniella sp. TaxID=1955812 RepID=UPI002AFF6E35|nr:hypothetical protein [Castellaniella sp.]